MPCHSLVPDLVVRQIAPPALWPLDASTLFWETTDSCTSSWFGGYPALCPIPIGLPSTSRLFFRLVSPPRSTLFAAHDWYGSISPRVLIAAGSIRVSLNGLRSMRGVSLAILVSIVKSTSL